MDRSDGEVRKQARPCLSQAQVHRLEFKCGEIFAVPKVGIDPSARPAQRKLMGTVAAVSVLVATGLATLFAGQAFTNILVYLQLFPSKGIDPAAGQLRRIGDVRAGRADLAVAGLHTPQPVPHPRGCRDHRGAAERTQAVSGPSRHYVLAAGGTGGHLTPAFALAHTAQLAPVLKISGRLARLLQTPTSQDSWADARIFLHAAEGAA